MTRALREFLLGERIRRHIAPHVYGGPHYYADIVNEVCRLENAAQLDLCDRESLVAALRLAVSWPLTIGAKDGSALLVRPNHDESNARPRVVAMQKARGKIQILKQFGGLRWFNARPVFANEEFKAFQGEQPRIEVHQDRSFDKHGRGTLVGAYAIAITSHSDPKTLVLLHRSDIDAIRQEFSAEWADGALDDIEWYAVKTAIHKLCESIVLPDLARRLLDDGGQSGRFAAAPQPDIAGTITVPVADPRGVIESIAQADGSGAAASGDAIEIMRQVQVA